MVYTLYQFAQIVGSCLLGAAFLTAPWVFRSNLENAEKTVYSFVVGAAVCAVIAVLTAPVHVRRVRSHFRLFPAALLVLAGAAFGFLQTIPFSESTVSSLSPAVLEMDRNLLPLPETQEYDLETQVLTPGEPESALNPGAETCRKRTLSICPRMTKDQISQLLLAFAAMVSGGILFQTKRQRLLLWRFAAVNGVLLVLLLIGQKVMGDSLPGYRHFWPTAECATFRNKNGLAGYLCLCLAPALGLLFWEITKGIRRRDDEEIYYDGVRYEQRSLPIRFLNGISDFFSLFSGNVIPWLAAVVLLLAGAALTLSRGGTIAGCLAFLTAAALFTSRKRSGLFLIPVWGGLAAAFFLLIWLGLKEPVQQRMETLLDSGEQRSAVLTDSRLDNWKNTFDSAKTYKWRGSGLGTYSVANRINDHSLRTNRYFCFAENQAVETLLTAGWPGLVLLFGEILLFWLYVFRALRFGRSADREVSSDDETEFQYIQQRANADLAFVFGVGAAALLMGQMISGSFDFGLFLYPNALTAAVLFGSFAGGDLRLDDSSEEAAFAAPARSKIRRTFEFLLGLFLAVSAAALAYFALGEERNRIESNKVIERYLSDVDPRERNDDFFKKAVGDFQWALAMRPDDPYLRYQLAQVYIGRFRNMFWNELKEDSPNEDGEALWIRSAPEAVYANMQPFFKSKMTVIPRRFRSDPIVPENLTPALRELWISRRICPLFPEPHIQTAILTPLLFQLDDPGAFSGESLRRASEVSPNEPGVLFSTGLVEFLSGNRDKAVQQWKNSLALSDEHLADVTHILSSERLKADFRRYLGETIGGDWHKAELGATLFPKKENPLIYSVYLELMLQILNAGKENPTPEWNRNSARFSALSDHPADADSYYKKALEGDPFNAQWHYEYGMFLLRNKRKAEAADEFSRALEIEPKNGIFRDAAQAHSEE